MKKYQIIGLTLWTLGNIILTLRIWDYILIAPVLAIQVAVWICCSILFAIDISSRGLFIEINTTLVITGLLGILYFLYYRNPIGVVTLIAVFAVIFKNFVWGRKRKQNCFVTDEFDEKKETKEACHSGCASFALRINLIAHAANAFALTCSIIFRMPIQTLKSVKISTTLPLSVNGASCKTERSFITPLWTIYSTI